jgi:hypothetical protein
MQSFWTISAYFLIVLAPCLVAVRNFSSESERWGGPRQQVRTPAVRPFLDGGSPLQQHIPPLRLPRRLRRSPGVPATLGKDNREAGV